MAHEHRSFPHAKLNDDELLAEIVRLAASERLATVQLIAALAEVDSRRLYLGQGCSSLFVYCTSILRLSEHAAYGRIEAARAARRFPVLLEMLRCGELTLTSLCLVAPHLTESNHIEVLARARRRSKRDVEEIVVSLRPKADVPVLIRKVPEQRWNGEPVSDFPFATPPPRPEIVSDASAPVALPTARKPSSPAPATVQPLAPERYKLQVTISAETRAKLQHAQDLLRHSLPSGDIAVVLDRALELLVTDLERKKAASITRPRRGTSPPGDSRHIPAHVRRAVWTRDGGQCAFSGAERRCDERAFLEFHHVTLFAAGGEASVENIQLRCRAHNQYEADVFFGEPLIVRERAPAWSDSGQDRVVRPC